MGFPPGLIEEIRSRVDLVELVGEHVTLRRSGRNWVGLCPFHEERTPSFTVSPERGLFYCFGCQTGGDAIAFLMKREGLTFPDAVERLAARLGIDPGPRRGEGVAGARAGERARLLQINGLVAGYFARCLLAPRGSLARAYLQRRGVRPEIAERFGLGYAPADGRELEAALQEAGVEPAEAVRAGVLAPGGAGRQPFPRFRDRLMFPVQDAAGRVLGFGGRLLREGAPGPKYLNSPETPVFRKRWVLYGLPGAVEGMRREGRAVVVEGYLDVITLHQAGIDWAVATLGTALTPEHARLLARYAREVVLAFDSDRAGRLATDRGLDLVEAAGLRVSVASLPAGDDPDSWVRREGPDPFRRAVDAAWSLTEYRLRRALGNRVPRTDLERGRMVAAVVPILARLQSASEREAYAARVAARLGVPVTGLLADVEAARSGPGRGRGARRARRPEENGNQGSRRHSSGQGTYTTVAEYASSTAGGGGLEAVEKTLVRWMVEHSDLARQVLDAMDGQPLERVELEGVRVFVRELLARGASWSRGEELAAMAPEEVSEQVDGLLALPLRQPVEPEAYARQAARLRVRARLQLLEAHLTDLEGSAGEDDAARLSRLLVEYGRLRKSVAGAGPLRV